MQGRSRAVMRAGVFSNSVKKLSLGQKQGRQGHSYVLSEGEKQG